MNTMKQSKSDYGYFTDTFDFKLIDPHTPRPWWHLMSNEEYFLYLNQFGSGYSCYKNRLGNLVTKSIEPDRNDSGRFFYIRDKSSREFFSPTVFPCQNGLKNYSGYECIYSPGYLTWNVRYKNIQSSIKTLVCIDKNVELYLLTLENNEKKRAELDCFLLLEWDFSGASREDGGAINTHFDKSLNTHIANLNVPPEYRFSQTGFITSTETIADFDSRYLAFIGSMGTISRPDAVVNGKCSNSGEPLIGTTCGAVRVSLVLEPSECRQLMFAVGISENTEKLKNLIPEFHKKEKFSTELEKVNSYWKNIFAMQKIQAPSEVLTNFCDSWLKYQVVQNARWTRWGAEKGYRDVLQDAAGMRFLDISKSKNMIIDAVKRQKCDGNAPRQWSNVPWRKWDWDDYRDSCIWQVYAIDCYLRETGDLEFLEDKLPFCDDKNSATVWDHINRAADFLYNNRGSHGLCLIGKGDWLDSLNRTGLKGKGESVWLSQLFAWSLKRMVDIALASGKSSYIDKFEWQYASIYDALNQHGWDGNWYLRGYTDDGQPVGSHRCTGGGKIFLNPQTWAVISGTAPDDRINLSLKAIEEHLQIKWGTLLYSPRYLKYDENIGRLSIGASEADTVYIHAVTFQILAELMLGNSEKALNLINCIVPAVRHLPASQSGAEPFCCVNALAGNGWSRPGWSYTGWWTATVDWLLKIMVEWIYGARAEYGGLRIDPHLPLSWDNASIIRSLRNSTYTIDVSRSNDVQKNPIVIVDGKKINSTLIPYYSDGKQHSVTVNV